MNDKLNFRTGVVNGNMKKRYVVPFVTSVMRLDKSGKKTAWRMTPVSR